MRCIVAPLPHVRWMAVVLVACLIGCRADKELTLYKCDDEVSAESCTGSCKENDGSVSMELRANKESKSVLQIMYMNSVRKSSGIIKNCVVFDDENWHCERETKTDYIENKSVSKMVNGVYTEINGTYYLENPNRNVKISSCAKKPE